MGSTPYAMILGTGMAVPEKRLTNAALEKRVGVSDDWIRERTGICERRIAEPGTPLSQLAVRAARLALEESGIGPGDVDLIIVGTVTGDMKTPSAACFVQEKLGARNAVGFDISAACSGFLYSLQVGEGLMRSFGYRHALIIGGDILSSTLDWEDRDTAVLFGDGVGAAVLGPSRDGRGILATHLRSDGAFTRYLYNPGCGSLNPPSPENVRGKINSIRMEGLEVFRHAVLSMADALRKALEMAGVGKEELDLVIPHQANLRIIQTLAKRVGLPLEKFFINVQTYGNTSAASIPIALDEALKGGVLKAGDLVGMASFGAGFAWASGVLRI
jgi:3-oxoacyl-[acyl-carrier-protein] synthase-3